MKTTIYALRFNFAAPGPFIHKFLASNGYYEPEGENKLNWFYVGVCDTPVEHLAVKYPNKQSAEAYITKHNCSDILQVIEVEVNWKDY